MVTLTSKSNHPGQHHSDRQQVYISIAVDEGQTYQVNKVNLVGELGDVKADDLRSLIIVQEVKRSLKR